MSKNKRKGGDRELEELRGMLRRAQKQLKEARKHHRLIEEYDPNEPVEVVAESSSKDFNKCPTCRNNLVQLDLGIKIVNVCNECGYRRVLNGSAKET